MSSELERHLEELAGKIPPTNPDHEVIGQITEAVRKRDDDIKAGNPPGLIVYEAYSPTEKSREDRYLEIADNLNEIGRYFADDVALQSVAGDHRHPSAYPTFRERIEQLDPREKILVNTRLRAPLRNQHLPHVPTTIGGIRNMSLEDLAALRNVGPKGAEFLQRTFARQPNMPKA